MTNELQAVKTELMIAKQQAEIINLRANLQKLQTEKSSRLEDSLFAPSLFPHYQKVAETISKSNMIPTAYRGKPDDIFVAMAMGYQLGFPVEQSLQDIAVINGRPCIWGDGLLSLVLSHPDCENIKEEPVYNGNIVIGYICSIKRKGHEWHAKTFTIQDAERAGLLKKGGVWSSYPERMLQMRARSLALRDKFSDALRGLRVAEVEQDDSTVIEGEAINISNPASQVDKLKSILKNNSSQEKVVNEPENTQETTEDKPASEEQIAEIERLMVEKEFDDTRRQNALNYFKVGSLSELTEVNANKFLMQLGKR